VTLGREGGRVEILVRSTVRRPGMTLGDVRRLALWVLRGEGVRGKELSVLLVGRRAMRTLNERYTGRKGPTDVLAFGTEGALHAGTVLGDVCVCVDRARAQGREAGEPLRDAVARLVIHGLLHLCGYDHTRGAAEAGRMESREETLLRRWRR
jgi:probable rRNA maturation factor